jgi:hypothetical protein
MAEYYSVLKKAIGGLESNQADIRRTVYDKARNALIGQLKAVDPPLTTAEISRQRLELEEAIRKVEREAVANPPAIRAPAIRAAPASSPTPVRAPPPTPARAPPPARSAAPARMAAPPPEPLEEPIDDGPSPQDVFRRAIQEAESRGNAAGAAAGAIERAAVAMRAEANQYVPPRDGEARTEVTQYGGATAELRQNRERISDRAAPPPVPVRREEPRTDDYEIHDPREDEPEDEPPPEPRLAPEYNPDWDNRGDEPPVVGRRERPSLPARRKPAYRDDDEREVLEREARPSRLPALLLTVLIIAVIGGVGALAWSKRAMIGQIITALDGSKSSRSKLAPPAVADASAAPSKDTDRLLDSDAAPPAKVVRSVEPPADDSAAPGAPSASPGAPPAAPATGAAAPDGDAGSNPPAAADEASPSSPPAPLVASANDGGAGGGVLVAQKAVLYEEPVNASGDANATVTTLNAAVTWRYVENSANGPSIEADLQVPARNLKLKVTIHKNADKSLPASHLIEIQVDTPSDLPGKGIKKVPRIVMKPTEEARGQPLVGAEAKITDGFFWIALSASEADISANLALLREREWIDLPFVYDTGQRAILTFEKGPQGDQVFQKAMAAWTG